MSSSPVSRLLDNSSPVCPEKVKRAAPVDASANPGSFVGVRRSPTNEAARAVRTGMVVGTMSAPSDAGAIVRPTKTNALYAQYPNTPATTTGQGLPRPRFARVASVIAARTIAAMMKRAAEISRGGAVASASFPVIQEPLQASATQNAASEVRSERGMLEPYVARCGRAPRAHHRHLRFRRQSPRRAPCVAWRRSPRPRARTSAVQEPRGDQGSRAYP